MDQIPSCSAPWNESQRSFVSCPVPGHRYESRLAQGAPGAENDTLWTCIDAARSGGERPA